MIVKKRLQREQYEIFLFKKIRETNVKLEFSPLYESFVSETSVFTKRLHISLI